MKKYSEGVRSTEEELQEFSAQREEWKKRGLSSRAINALASEGLLNDSAVRNAIRLNFDFRKVPNLGSKTIQEIRDFF